MFKRILWFVGFVSLVSTVFTGCFFASEDVSDEVDEIAVVEEAPVEAEIGHLRHVYSLDDLVGEKDFVVFYDRARDGAVYGSTVVHNYDSHHGSSIDEMGESVIYNNVDCVDKKDAFGVEWCDVDYVATVRTKDVDEFKEGYIEQFYDGTEAPEGYLENFGSISNGREGYLENVGYDNSVEGYLQNVGYRAYSEGYLENVGGYSEDIDYVRYIAGDSEDVNYLDMVGDDSSNVDYVTRFGGDSSSDADYLKNVNSYSSDVDYVQAFGYGSSDVGYLENGFGGDSDVVGYVEQFND